jgi:hypothetical protein
MSTSFRMSGSGFPYIRFGCCCSRQRCWPAARPSNRPPSATTVTCRRSQPCRRRSRNSPASAAHASRLDGRAWRKRRKYAERSRGKGQCRRACQPRREGYINAIQIYPWSEGALYQVYAAPGRSPTSRSSRRKPDGAGPIAAGDTARWIIGDTESGTGLAPRPYPRQTDAPRHHHEPGHHDRPPHLHARAAGGRNLYAGRCLGYPALPASQRGTVPATPIIPTAAARHYPLRHHRRHAALAAGRRL